MSRQGARRRKKKDEEAQRQKLIAYVASLSKRMAADAAEHMNRQILQTKNPQGPT